VYLQLYAPSGLTSQLDPSKQNGALTSTAPILLTAVLRMGRWRGPQDGDYDVTTSTTTILPSPRRPIALPLLLICNEKQVAHNSKIAVL
jgi:hypothetical protein